jgi:hypothetical protein
VFENRVLREEEEKSGGSRKLHYEEVHNLLALPNNKGDQIMQDGCGR